MNNSITSINDFTVTSFCHYIQTTNIGWKFSELDNNFRVIHSTTTSVLSKIRNRLLTDHTKLGWITIYNANGVTSDFGYLVITKDIITFVLLDQDLYHETYFEEILVSYIQNGISLKDAFVMLYLN